ncbi:MAG: phosphodiester glycosidase family protein [Chloroflexi bacterium]|nr:phosphodiester glycosidase family protein [Chloroflexota bacterium]
MKPKRTFRRALIVLLVLIGLALGGYAIYNGDRPAPVPLKQTLFDGVTYHRIVRYVPRFVIAHVLIIDTRVKGTYLFVTPPDHAEGPPLDARTTSQFLQEFGVQIAVNGDGFTPWWSRTPLDYYPHAGDPVTPNGYSASGGTIYARGDQDPTPEPTLFISRRNALSFNKIPGRVYHAISGDYMLVQQGKPVAGLDDTAINPRTAIGTSANGRWLYLVVVDGRQPFYSEGMTFAELANLLDGLGVANAMSLDGGGSSTMVIQGEDGQPKILNSPIDHYIPGTERPVANHLGIYLRK